MRMESLFRAKKPTGIVRIASAIAILGIVAVSALGAGSGPSSDARAMMWPVKGARITLDYGKTIEHPVTHKPYRHAGVDLAASTGSAVVASGAGSVLEVGTKDKEGNYVIIGHDGGLVSMYYHLGSIAVSKGQRVAEGDKIATLGSSGVSTGPHVHFEVQRDGTDIDPHQLVK